MVPRTISNDGLIEQPPLDNRNTMNESPQHLRRTPKRTFSHKFRANSFVTQNSASFFDHYQIVQALGEGGYGEAFVCEHTKSGDRRAVKVLDASDDTARERVMNEFNMLKGVDHPNLIKTYQLYEDKENSRFFIVSDLYEGGELFDDVAENGPRSEEDAAVIMNQLLSCVNYLHKQGIAHRDLKLENMLLGNQEMNAEDMKVIDFGLATKFDPDRYDDVCFEELIGSTYYMAPEVLHGQAGPKCDIWSCGVVAYVLLSGDAPFFGDTEEEIFAKIKDGDFTFDKNPAFKNVSPLAKDFIRWLLSYDEEDRPSAEKALKHPWMTRSRRNSRLGFMKGDSIAIISSLANLEKFSAESKLEQAVYAFIASQLITNQEKDDIDRLFRTLDCDCDGRLDKHELRRGYKTLLNKTLNEREIDAIFSRVNFSCSGAIEYSEFVVAAMNPKLLLDDFRLRAVFKEFDQDDTGYLTAADLNKALDLEQLCPFLRDCTLSKILVEVDSDMDGQISFEEFQLAMRSKPTSVTDRPRRGRRFAIFKPSIVRRAVSDDVELSIEDNTGPRKTKSGTFGWYRAIKSSNMNLPVHNPAA